jgi:hypothetical protein
MNDSSDGLVDDSVSDFSSPNSVNITIDGPGDSTVRPCRPEHLAQLMAERDKIARWQHLSKQPPECDKPADSSEGPANAGS